MRFRYANPMRGGFTLIEVTITMLVLAILTAVAAPSYISALASNRADMAARKVVADLHFARTEAQRYSQSRTVEFDIANGRYTLVSIASLDRSTAGYVVNLVDDPFAAALVSATFGADANVTFDMYGRPDSDGTVVVQAGNFQKTITLASDGQASY